MPLYVPDQIDGQAVTMMLYPGGSGGTGVPLAGLQFVTWTYTTPKKLVLDSSGVKRYQRTDTDQVTWQCSQFTIYKQTFADSMGLTSNPAINYGALPWDRFMFDLAENFLRQDDQGNVVQAGGALLRNAQVTEYVVTYSDPVSIVMTNVSGLAMAPAPKDWT